MSIAIWYLATLLNIALAAAVMARRRYAIVRPSVQVSCFYLILLVLPLCMNVRQVESFLPDFAALTVVLQTLVSVPLIAALSRNDTTSRLIWQRVANGRLASLSFEWKQLFVLAICCVLIATWYLSTIPLASTGLYVMFTNPAAAALAREESFKLLESAPLRYAFAIMALTAAPMLLVLIMTSIARNGRAPVSRRLTGNSIGILVLMMLTFLVSLSGARSFAVTLWLTAFAAIWFSSGLRIRTAGGLFVGAAFLLLVPVLLTLAREGHLRDLGIFWEYFGNFIAYRIFTAPAEVGTWYVHYAQTEGSIGISAVPKLAELMGYPSINIPNVIGRSYYGGSLMSINANAGFGFTYYAYFGAFGWLASIVGVMCLDLVLIVYRRLRGAVLLASLAATSVATLAFTYADFTTVMLTNGFLIAPAIAWLLSTSKLASRPESSLMEQS